MNTGFDPLATRQRLDADNVVSLQGTLQRLDSNYQHLLKTGLIHNAVFLNLYDVVLARIVGADKAASENLLSLMTDWADISLAQHEWELRQFAAEQGSSAYKKATSIANKLDCLWLANQVLEHNLVVAYDKAVANYVVDAGGTGDAYSLELMVEKLASYGLWDAVTTRINDFKKTGIGKPLRSGTKALAALAGEPAAVDDPNSAICKQLVNWLDSNLEHLLKHGSLNRVLQWLRIVEWREGRSGMDTDQVLQCAYKYLKDIERP